MQDTEPDTTEEIELKALDIDTDKISTMDDYLFWIHVEWKVLKEIRRSLKAVNGVIDALERMTDTPRTDETGRTS